MRRIGSLKALENYGRIRLSKSFFMRDMLHSEISNLYGIPNIPSDPDLAVEVGRALCENLLEPLQEKFGKVSIRSAYRSSAVNQFGNKREYGCASNAKNAGKHIWDVRDKNGQYGAMATIVINSLIPYFETPGSWKAIAWYIHDNLPYSTLCFYPKLGAFNIGWHQCPERRIISQIPPRCCLTRDGMENHTGSHLSDYDDMLSWYEALKL